MHDLLRLAVSVPSYFLQGIDGDILMRIALSLVAGTLLGIERERHGRAAGLRTTLLVSLSSCVAMIVSDGFYQESFRQSGMESGWHPDPARLAAGILAGMGFLGAGVIVRQRDHVVRGVTTAASLWFASIIGLAFGAGAIGVGWIATLCALVILILLPFLESRILCDWYSDLEVSFSSAECTVQGIAEVLGSLGVRIKAVDLDENLVRKRCRATFHLKYKRKGILVHSERLLERVRSMPGVTRVSLST